MKPVFYSPTTPASRGVVRPKPESPKWCVPSSSDASEDLNAERFIAEIPLMSQSHLTSGLLEIAMGS